MLSIERQAGPNTVFSASYVGSASHRRRVLIESNPGNPSLCLSLSQGETRSQFYFLPVKPQVPPLRFALVGMTILLQNEHYRVKPSISNEFVIPTGACPDFLLRATHQRPRVRSRRAGTA
jgi:hypothetical protein